MRRELIELYSKAPVEEVHAGSRYQRLYARYDTDPRRRRAFFRVRQRVEQLRSRIDDHLGDQATSQLQVQMALRLIWRLRRDDLQEPAIGMILTAYGDGWSDEQRDYFEQWARRFLDATPYFLSFTTRNRAFPQLNHVNRHHEHFIRNALGNDVYEAADLGAQNLVAEAVHYHLVNRRAGGFYFQQHQGDNQDIEEKILDQLRRCLALVQLVQGESFRHYDERRNWCHLEYRTVRNADARRVLFVEIEPDIDPDEVHLDFNDWYQDYVDKDNIRLAWTRQAEEVTRVEENFRQLTENLVAQIDEARVRVLREIPVS